MNYFFLIKQKKKKKKKGGCDSDTIQLTIQGCQTQNFI